MKFEQLREFRQLAYECLGNAKDAIFELADAIMTTRHVSCLGDLAPMHVPSKNVPMNINPQPYPTLYLSASVKDIVRSH